MEISEDGRARIEALFTEFYREEKGNRLSSFALNGFYSRIMDILSNGKEEEKSAPQRVEKSVAGGNDDPSG